MVNADLKLYVGATEYGTLGNPISFGNVNAGTIYPHLSNPFYLWNDKGGALNSVPARNITVQVLNLWIEDENVGTSTGLADQTFTVDFPPVVDNDDPSEFVLKVDTVTWTRVGNLAGQASNATVYTLNSTTGLITFGNGVNGAIPDASAVIYVTYMPDTIVYGKEVFENTWLEVKSLGVTSNTVTVSNEAQISLSTTTVLVANNLVTAVTGVWLLSDPSHLGTNYYTGGSFNAYTGVITLGTPVASTGVALLIEYTYVPIDDFESSYYPIGFETTHTFTYPIPQNNAKLLYFRLNVPASATASGGSQVNFRLRVSYTQ